MRTTAILRDFKYFNTIIIKTLRGFGFSSLMSLWDLCNINSVVCITICAIVGNVETPHTRPDRNVFERRFEQLPVRVYNATRYLGGSHSSEWYVLICTTFALALSSVVRSERYTSSWKFHPDPVDRASRTADFGRSSQYYHRSPSTGPARIRLCAHRTTVLRRFRELGEKRTRVCTVTFKRTLRLNVLRGDASLENVSLDAHTRRDGIRETIVYRFINTDRYVCTCVRIRRLGSEEGERPPPRDILT